MLVALLVMMHSLYFLLPYHVEYKTMTLFLHVREWRRSLWVISFFRKSPYGRNIPLLCTGDVKRNPGPMELAAKKMKKSQLTIVHVNTRSPPRHFDGVTALVSSHRPDVLALSETWLDSAIDDKEISLPGFVCFVQIVIAVWVVQEYTVLITYVVP